jgi:hypothetical protein
MRAPFLIIIAIFFLGLALLPFVPFLISTPYVTPKLQPPIFAVFLREVCVHASRISCFFSGLFESFSRSAFPLAVSDTVM